MKLTNLLLFWLSVVLAILLAFISWKYLELVQHTSENSCNSALEICYSSKATLKQHLLNYYQLDNSSSLHNIQIADVKNERPVEIWEELNFPVLVLYIPSNTCESCFSQQLFLITSIFGKNCEQVVLLFSDKPLGKIETLFARSRANFPIYYIYDGTDPDFTGSGEPVYFVLSKDLKLHFPFIVDETEVTMPEAYLIAMKRKFDDWAEN